MSLVVYNYYKNHVICSFCVCTKIQIFALFVIRGFKNLATTYNKFGIFKSNWSDRVVNDKLFFYYYVYQCMHYIYDQMPGIYHWKINKKRKRIGSPKSTYMYLIKQVHFIAYREARETRLVSLHVHIAGYTMYCTCVCVCVYHVLPVYAVQCIQSEISLKRVHEPAISGCWGPIYRKSSFNAYCIYMYICSPTEIGLYPKDEAKFKAITMQMYAHSPTMKNMYM